MKRHQNSNSIVRCICFYTFMLKQNRWKRCLSYLFTYHWRIKTVIYRQRNQTALNFDKEPLLSKLSSINLSFGSKKFLRNLAVIAWTYCRLDFVLLSCSSCTVIASYPLLSIAKVSGSHLSAVAKRFFSTWVYSYLPARDVVSKAFAVKSIREAW